MIVAGLLLEFIAGLALLVALPLGAGGIPLLIGSMLVLPVALILVAVGVRHARPPRRGVTAIPPAVWSGAASEPE